MLLSHSTTLNRLKPTLAAHAAATGLPVLIDLFACLNERGVRYCHWKSTQRIPVSLQGRTDLDLLIDRAHGDCFKQILAERGFKAFVSHPSRQFPGIEDYLGFDRSTGRMVHLHLHYRLVLGEQFVKNYYLPLEQSFLDHTTIQHGLKVPIPELEIAVLSLRALLKYRDRDLLKDALKLGRSSGIPAAILQELAALQAQTDLPSIADCVDRHIGIVSSAFVIDVLETLATSPRSAGKLWHMRRHVRRELAPFQRYSRLRAQARYFEVMLTRQWPFDRVLRRILPLRDKHKIPASGGLTIALVGADGAGKSTVIEQLVKWLKWRLVVRTLYMGNSRPSRGTLVVKSVSKLVRRGHSGARRMLGDTHVVTRAIARANRLGEALRYLADARDRHGRYLEGRRQAARGAIVIFDRYPLQDVHIGQRSMDGPRIDARTGDGKLVARLAEREARLYQHILPSDHTVVLNVSPDVSFGRKPEHDPALLAAKSAAVRSIAGDETTMLIDADQPIDDVVLQIKERIWSWL